MVESTHIMVSLESRHAESIFSGSKRVELRRRSMNVEPGSVMWIYEKLPVGGVTGFVTINAVEQATPNSLWRKYGQLSGLTKREFFEYYLGARIATALHLSDPIMLPKSVTLARLRSAFESFHPPQFFSHIRPDAPLLRALSSAL